MASANDNDQEQRPGVTTDSYLVFSWGRGDLGQLGLGNDSDRDHPTLLESFVKKDIVHIAASDYHTAFLTDEGELYTSGSNESGQLGIQTYENQLLPAPVLSLDTQTIIHVACGQGHTVAVTESGALATWGAAEFGQLGKKEAVGVMNVAHPRILKGSREHHFVRVACGATHTLALTGSGGVYSFGQGTFGALGHGNTESYYTPTFVEELWGFGIVQIACGENHSVALSVDGRVFSWGRGKYGQLGHGLMNNETKPSPVRALADQMIVQVVCGGDHTLALNNDGEIYTWGRGHWGQTGLGILDDIHTPTQVQFPVKEFITQASAGARHSIVLTKEGKVYGWGDGEQGQLGKLESDKKQAKPFVINDAMKSNLEASYVVAGGEHTFIVYKNTFESSLQSKPDDMTVENEDEKMMLGEKDHDRLSRKEQYDLGLITTFSCLPSDTLHGDGLRPVKLPALHSILEDSVDSAKKLTVVGHAVEDIFSSTRFIVLAFKHQPSFWHNHDEVSKNLQKNHTELDDHGLDVELIRNVYQGILELRNPEILKKLADSIIRLFIGIEKHMATVPQSRWIRILLIGLQSPLIGEKGVGELVSERIFLVFSRLSASNGKKITLWLRTYPRDIFGGRFVRGVLRYLSNRKEFSSRRGVFQDVTAAIKVLCLLHEANSVEKLISYTEFYSKDISENVDLQEEYLKWQHYQFEKELHTFVSFCQVPFILTPQAKSSVLQVESYICQQKIVQASVFRHLLGDFLACPFLIFRVRRTHLIQDTLSHLNVEQIHYKKPLKVIFEGEEGVDEGGVTKEFFQILCRELFNADYGMFTYDDETRNFWFNSNSWETEDTFELVGTILGLGIYNNVILDVHLPLVVYKKLLGLKADLDDLKDVQPQLAKSLRQLLDFDGDVENTFCLTFQISYDYFGELKTHDLQPGGSDIPVTSENKERYVELYVKYLLEESIQNQFAAFNKGFQQVCGGHALQLFNHEELELLICGLPHYDFDALEKVTVYQGGYTKDSDIIKWFWEVVREMTLEERKSLLFFTTGNDRAPVGGLGSLQFIIQKNDGDTDRLPTSHTCFNILLLPEYCSKAKLENRLKLAISNSTGFGLQ